MLETGARAGEVVGLQVTDLDLPGGRAVIRRGKGGRGRIVLFGPHTARDLDRYPRLRAHHRLAAGGSEGGLMAVAGWTRPA